MMKTTINFKNIDTGYDEFVKFAKAQGFDWTTVRDSGIVAYVKVLKSPKIQTAFDIPASKKAENGEDLNEFAVMAGMFEGVRQTLQSLQSRVNFGLKVSDIRINRNALVFSIGKI